MMKSVVKKNIEMKNVFLKIDNEYFRWQELFYVNNDEMWRNELKLDFFFFIREIYEMYVYLDFLIVFIKFLIF